MKAHIYTKNDVHRNFLMVNTKSDVKETLRKHEDILRSFGVRRVGLFGSFLHETVKPDSDVDLLVEFEAGEKTFNNFFNLIFYLEEILQRPVEVVTRESLSPYLGPRILKDMEYVSIGA